MVPSIPAGYPTRHIPCLWIPSSRAGTPKRGRDGEGSSTDEEMRDQVSKRRTSAPDKEGRDMLAPSDVNVTTTIELCGKYGAAPTVFTGLLYDLGLVLQNPLRRYPSPSAMYGM